MIDVLRNELSRLQSECGRKVRDIKGVVITIRPEETICPQCMKEMGVRNSYPRKLTTIKYGNVSARVITLKCNEGCQTLDGSKVLRHPNIISCIVPKRASIAYDIEVDVGLQRYLHYRQREEIRDHLCEKDIHISTGKITNLAHSFLRHFGLLHVKRSSALKEAIDQDGGYIGHADATGECGTGTLFVIVDGWHGWVLGAWRLTTECADQIKPCLNETEEKFGVPRAIMRDYGKAMIPAVQEFVDSCEEDIEILGCHQHFCGFVGKDLLKEAYDKLGTLLRKHGFKTPLAAIVREWGKRNGVQEPGVKQALEKWNEDLKSYSIPEGPIGVAALRSHVQWVLDIHSETNNLRFPFDLPHLIFYDQCKTLRRACNAFFKHAPKDPYLLRSIKRLAKILDPIITDGNFTEVTKILRRRNSLFIELRSALRVIPKMSGIKKPISQPLDVQLSELNDIKKAVAKLKISLLERRPKRGPGEDTRNAIDTILKHFDKHEESLWGHVVQLPEHAGGGIRLIERTSLPAEGLFGGYKRGIRRQTGKKILTHELESIPPESILVSNLKDPRYVQILCGSIEELPMAFAELDREEEHRLAMLKLKSNEQPGTSQKNRPKIETASLSQSDKNFVRKPSLKFKILKAANSRTPRFEPSCQTLH
jgi:hypothetical protein